MSHEFFGLGIEIGIPPVPVEREKGIADVLQRLGQTPAKLISFPSGARQLGDVLYRALHGNDPASVIFHGHANGANLDAIALYGDQVADVIKGSAVLGAILEDLPRRVAFFGCKIIDTILERRGVPGGSSWMAAVPSVHITF